MLVHTFFLLPLTFLMVLQAIACSESFLYFFTTLKTQELRLEINHQEFLHEMI